MPSTCSKKFECWPSLADRAEIHRKNAGAAGTIGNTVGLVRAVDRVLPHPPRRLPVLGDIAAHEYVQRWMYAVCGRRVLAGR